jgi:hypothetical protein
VGDRITQLSSGDYAHYAHSEWIDAVPPVEHLPVAVRVTVEVDGHKLTFTKSGTAMGARYYGHSSDCDGATLEDNLRGVIDALLVYTANMANRTLRGVYPVAADRGVRPPEKDGVN